MDLFSRTAGAVMRSLTMRALLSWERIDSGVANDPVSSALLAYPYSLYEEQRTKDPVHRMRLQDVWVLSGYADVDFVLRDHRRFGNTGREFGYILQVSMLDLSTRRLVDWCPTSLHRGRYPRWSRESGTR